MPLEALYELPAPAKLNLFLHIVGRRDDGHHLLQSIFVLIDWADTLHVERRSDGRLARHDLGEPLPADDLCLRAARALQAASGSSFGADIHVDKRLPSGAGMGGGSSDAATVLLALNRLWGLNWPRAALLPLALTLGADVPFFIGGHDAFVEGIGERLTPVALPPGSYAVVKPPAHIATRDIFEHPALRRDRETVILAGSGEDAGFQAAALAGWLQQVPHGWGTNDLQAPAEDRCNEVAEAARWLQRRYGNSRMTGSGSAVFARVGADDPAPFPAGELPPGWVGRKCRGLVRHPLAGWAD
jgi:4-diphosphocytidyl-2-C-methyl-D-erythritol kinase